MKKKPKFTMSKDGVIRPVRPITSLELVRLVKAYRTIHVVEAEFVDNPNVWFCAAAGRYTDGFFQIEYNLLVFKRTLPDPDGFNEIIETFRLNNRMYGSRKPQQILLHAYRINL